jgi:hypothetical protein
VQILMPLTLQPAGRSKILRPERRRMPLGTVCGKCKNWLRVMKQQIRKGLKQIIVDQVPDRAVIPHHALVRPLYSLNSSGTKTASLHQEGALRAVADYPSQLAKTWHVRKIQEPLSTLAEDRAEFSGYAVLSCLVARIVVDRHSVRNPRIGDQPASR